MKKNICRITREYQPWLPFWTLLRREFLRFSEIYVQALVTPVVSAALYLLVFGVSLGSRVMLPGEFSYVEFVFPGLIIMGICQSSFQNSAGTLFMARYLNYMVDFLVTPLSPVQYCIAFTLAAMARGLIVGIGIILIGFLFVEPHIANIAELILFALIGSFLFSQLGLLAGLFSDSFDTLSAITNFLILPIIYFSGMFYPVSLLSPFWQIISVFNPMYYLVEGFRGGWLGVREVGLGLVLMVPLLVSFCLFLVATLLMQRGYNTRT